MAEDLIDRNTLAELQQTVGCEFVVELVDTFLEEAPQMLAELRIALAARAADPFRRTAHSLKTNALTFGALALGAQARALELGGLPSEATGLDALETAYAETATKLRTFVHE